MPKKLALVAIVIVNVGGDGHVVDENLLRF